MDVVMIDKTFMNRARACGLDELTIVGALRQFSSPDGSGYDYLSALYALIEVLAWTRRASSSSRGRALESFAPLLDGLPLSHGAAARAPETAIKDHRHPVAPRGSAELVVTSSYPSVFRGLAALREDLTCDLSRRLTADGAEVCPLLGAPSVDIEPDDRASAVNASAMEPNGEQRTDSLPTASGAAVRAPVHVLASAIVAGLPLAAARLIQPNGRQPTDSLLTASSAANSALAHVQASAIVTGLPLAAARLIQPNGRQRTDSLPTASSAANSAPAHVQASAIVTGLPLAAARLIESNGGQRTDSLLTASSAAVRALAHVQAGVIVAGLPLVPARPIPSSGSSGVIPAVRRADYIGAHGEELTPGSAKAYQGDKTAARRKKQRQRSALPFS
jgi:hypothetical protein